MINHVATLLFNRIGPSRPTRGQDFYRETFSPIASALVSDIEPILYGNDFDTAGRLDRLWRYMGVLHGTEFSPYCTDLDLRITYIPTALPAAEYGVVVKGPSGLKIVGDYVSQTGRQATTWSFEGTGTGVVIVNQMTNQVAAYPLGQPGVLPGSTLRYSFQNPPEAGDRWLATYTARPVELVAVLQAFDSLIPAVKTAIFGTGSIPEPFLTFENLSLTGPSGIHRLAGYLFGYVYRLDSQRIIP